MENDESMENDENIGFFAKAMKRWCEVKFVRMKENNGRFHLSCTVVLYTTNNQFCLIITISIHRFIRITIQDQFCLIIIDSVHRSKLITTADHIC
jgi:hypothetical protein